MPKRSSADPAKIEAAVRVVLSGALSQRAAGKRYDVPKTTLRRAVQKARAEADRTGPDRGTESGPDRTAPNKSPERRTVLDSVTPDERLTGQQWKAATLTVAATMTAAQIAEAVGVSRSTIFEWRKDAVFQSVCDELRGAARVQAMETMSRAGEEAAHLARGTNRALARLLRDAERTLDLHEAGEEVDADAVKAARAMILALADKVPKGTTPMLDRSGFPKTERVEVRATVETGEERTDEELLAELEQIEPDLRVLEGGKA